MPPTSQTVTEATIVAVPQVMNDTERWAGIKSFDDMVAFLGEAGIEIHSTDEFGDGFKVIDDKDKLVKQPFMIVSLKFSDNGNFGEFAILHVMTRDGMKWILTDGSTGICAQVKLYANKGMVSGIYVPEGLIRSDYEYEDDKGKLTPAKTYYLS